MATVLFSLCFIDNAEFLLILIAGLAVLLAASLAIPKFRQAVVVPLSLASALFACLLFVVFTNSFVQNVRALDGTSADCSFYVIDEGEESQDSNVYTAKVFSANNVECDVKVVLYTEKRANLRPFAVYNGILDFHSVADTAFKSYGRYADGIYLNADCTLTDSTSKIVNSPYSYIVSLRQSIRNKLSYLMSDREGGLSVALVTGDKSYLDKNIKTAFVYSGTSHIMAVSGLHLSVVTGALLFILKKLKFKERTAGVICIAAVLVYMALAAFSGSVTRAGIMLIVMLSARLFSMRGDSLNALGLAVTLMCVANPYCVSDVGTDLSVLSVLSLITVYPFISSRFTVQYADPLDKTTAELVKERLYSVFCVIFTSLCVFAFTAPVLYVFFGYSSIVGPLTNLAAVPLGSLCVVMSFVTYIVSLVGINPLTAVAVLLTEKCDSLLIKFCTFFKDYGNSVLGFDYFFGLCIAGVLIIFALVFVSGNKRLFRSATVLSLAFLIATSAAVGIYNHNVLSLRVFQNGAMVFTYKDATVVYGVNGKTDYYSVKEYLQNNGLSVDYLVTDRSYLYPSKLSNDVFVNTLLCDEFDDKILVGGRYNNLEVQNTYSAYYDDFLFSFDRGEFTASFNGITIGTQKSADIFVNSVRVVDPDGCIKFRRDDVIAYKIRNKDSFKARRLNKWEK